MNNWSQRMTSLINVNGASDHSDSLPISKHYKYLHVKITDFESPSFIWDEIGLNPHKFMLGLQIFGKPKMVLIYKYNFSTTPSSILFKKYFSDKN